ncbi:MAG: NUDIX hydrolase [Bacteroidales bacterium]|nr:NUDIX hydrolase [Bacteroidales bacterium]
MPTVLRQSAAIPVRDGLLCMVTSKNRRRWVFPKGGIDPGHTAAESALIEAWEEAGLVGVLHGEPLGSYHYNKMGRIRHVTVFLMRVTELQPTWPEQSYRDRVWITRAEALSRIAEPGLRTLVRETIRYPLMERPERDGDFYDQAAGFGVSGNFH